MVMLTLSLEFFFNIFIVILTVVFILILVVLLKGLLQYRQFRNEKIWTKLIDKKVSEAIVYGKENTEDKCFDAFESKTSFRDLFLDKLVASEKKFSGIAQHEIRDLFEDYDLKKEAIQKINQKKPYLIAGGIQELTAMKVVEMLPKIETFLSHKDPQVYLEAQYAVVSFKGFEGLEFLNSSTNIISEWQQLRLLLSVPNIPENCDETIKSWLASSNTSVVIFVLSLLRKFQMLSFYGIVLNLLGHPADEVRIHALRTLQSLENEHTALELMDVFPSQSNDVQLEIMKILKFLKDTRNRDFFDTQLMQNPEIGIKILSAEGLCALGEENNLRVILHDENSPEFLVQIIKHALQEKI